MGTIENTVIVDLMQFMAYFNCGNALTGLADYEAALSSYSEALRIDRNEILNRNQAFFNRGNVYLDLCQFEQAISDYDAAMSLQAKGTNSLGIPFNKGNALVASGRFKDALECYKLAELGEDFVKMSSQNSETLERVMRAIGSGGYQSSFVKNPDAYVDRLVVQVARVGVEGVREVFPFQGRVGSTGNFGWHGVGGKGLSGSHGFIVEVVGKQNDDASTISPHRS